MLVKHIERLTQNRQNLRVFLPLSGKSKDISWLYKIYEFFNIYLIYFKIDKI